MDTSSTDKRVELVFDLFEVLVEGADLLNAHLEAGGFESFLPHGVERQQSQRLCFFSLLVRHLHVQPPVQTDQLLCLRQLPLIHLEDRFLHPQQQPHKNISQLFPKVLREDLLDLSVLPLPRCFHQPPQANQHLVSLSLLQFQILSYIANHWREFLLVQTPEGGPRHHHVLHQLPQILLGGCLRQTLQCPKVHTHVQYYILYPSLQRMNQGDRQVFFKQIFAILEQTPSKWSVIEVLQFLEIVKCGIFKQPIHQFGINGHMLLNSNTIEGVIVPQLKPSTILLFQKLMFVLRELRPPQTRQEDSVGQRSTRDTLSIPGPLMKAIRMAIGRSKQRNIILWSTNDLLMFLEDIGFSHFKEVIKQTSSDGFTMLYVVPDRRKLTRLANHFSSKELQEIVYISQILLAQSYMVETEEDEFEEVEWDPRQHSEIVFNMKKIPSCESVLDPPENEMLAISERAIYEQNDFIMTEQTSNTSFLERVEPLESNFTNSSLLTRDIRRDNSSNEEIYSPHLVQSIYADHTDRPTNNSFVTSEYPQEQIQRDLAESVYAEDPLQKSEYPSLVKSEYPQPQHETQFAESIEGSLRHQMDEGLSCSEYPEKQEPSSSMQDDDTDLIQESVLPERQPNCDNNLVPQEHHPLAESKSNFISNLMESTITFEDLKKVTLKLPFDLMNFENLNSITLTEERRHSENLPKTEAAMVIRSDEQTFGVKGCKFGRESENDYSYPDEMSISAKHAMLFFKEKRFYLQDLGSKTGTFKQIQKMDIFDGLIIQLAYEVQITFKIISRDTQGIIKVIFNRPPNMPNYQAIIPNKRNCKIGRSQNCKILIDSKNISVSHKHAQIAYEDQKFVFKDCQSINGSWLRLSEKGHRSELLPLEVNDKIRISSKKFFVVSNVNLHNMD